MNDRSERGEPFDWSRLEADQDAGKKSSPPTVPNVPTPSWQGGPCWCCGSFSIRACTRCRRPFCDSHGSEWGDSWPTISYTIPYCLECQRAMAWGQSWRTLKWFLLFVLVIIAFGMLVGLLKQWDLMPQ